MCSKKNSGGMGFRKLHDFNLALLGKQAWCFLNQPVLFVTKIFRARYFPRGTFLEATICNNLSYTWRSLYVT